MSGRGRLLTNIRTGVGHLFDILFFGPMHFITILLFLGTDGLIMIFLCDCNWCVGEDVGDNEAGTSRQGHHIPTSVSRKVLWGLASKADGLEQSQQALCIFLKKTNVG